MDLPFALHSDPLEESPHTAMILSHLSAILVPGCEGRGLLRTVMSTHGERGAEEAHQVVVLRVAGSNPVAPPRRSRDKGSGNRGRENSPDPSTCLVEHESSRSVPTTMFREAKANATRSSEFASGKHPAGHMYVNGIDYELAAIEAAEFASARSSTG